ncbi:MAG: GIY-YIG nuclease family protein [bacterium]|nr:GIY-YIG nuclease family protein [bacterium]MDZ4296196.1 GIY-YIG nuclease family protein [Patescibacteria group bacterium]
MDYYVYIAANKANTVLYTGVTNNLARRMAEHRSKTIEGFTKRYNVIKLVYYETFGNPTDAIIAEKRIKGWLRSKKVALIKSKNPEFRDLVDVML